jgi:NitT/TauT family transport system substrate-binding protein
MKTRNISILIILILFFITLTACDRSPKDKTPVTIAGLRGPTSMGMIRLFEEEALNSDSYEVTYLTEAAPDALTAKLLNNEIQIAAVPTNLASILYHRTEGGIQFLALNTLGVIHLVGTEPVDSLDDLKGQVLHISGKGATPDYAVNYMLSSLGLLDDMSLQFYADHASLAQAVLAGDAPYAVLPEPFVTQVVNQSNHIRLQLDLNKEWEKITSGSSVLSMGCLVISKEFAEENDDFVQDFLSQYEQSVNWVNTHPSDAGLLIAEHGILPNAQLAESAIPNSAIVFEDAKTAKDKINNFLKILFEYNPSSIGGSLPNDDFYYQ